MTFTELEIDTSSLAGGRKDMEESLGSIQGTLDGIYTEIEELNAMWAGPANQAFRNSFQQDKERIAQIVKGMRDYLEHLENVQREYESCEQAVADIVAAVRI